MGNPFKKPEVAIEVWDRLPCDNEESWQAFVSYRDHVPPRRIRAVAYGTARQVQEWYQANGWKERVVAYDQHMDSIVREERETILRQKTQDVAAEHMAALALARQIVDTELARILSVTKGGENGSHAPSAVLKPAEVIKLMEVVIKYDRLVRDQSTSNTSEVGPDLEKLSPEEFEAYGKLVDKMCEEKTVDPAFH